MIDYQVRPLDKTELHFLREMFYASFFVPEGQAPFPREMIDRPDLAKYIKDWGSGKDDLSLVAKRENELLGLVWGRSFTYANKGYGFVDKNTPEIGIAIRESFRGQGVGTVLIRSIQQKYLDLGVRRLSLSTDKRNAAKRLYERMGFQVVMEEETALTMLWEAGKK
ncbi:MAG: GNAT family N-acetyltransferase [Bacteroidota bacterium]